MTDPAGSANVEVVKRFYEAIETFLKSFDDDEALVTALSEEQQELRRSVTIEEAQALVAADALWEPLWSPSPFRGPAGIIDYGVHFTENMGEWSWAINAFHEVGENVIVECTVYTRGKASGVPTEQPMWNVFELAGGKITRYREFADESSARAAAS